MDAELVNPLLAATVDVLGKLANIEADVQKPFLKTAPEGKGVVSGIIVLKGNPAGTAAISFSLESILHVISKMLGEEVTEVNDDVKDAVGEITNMVSGLTTQLYEKEGLAMKAALDQVLLGEGHAVPHPPGFPVLGIPINTESGMINVEICFKNQESN